MASGFMEWIDALQSQGGRLYGEGRHEENARHMEISSLSACLMTIISIAFPPFASRLALSSM